LERVRSGGSTLAALRAGGDSAAGMRNSLTGSTVTRVGLNRTRPSTSRIFLDRQTGPHHRAGINVLIRAGHPHLHVKPIVAPRPKVVIHKDTTIIHHDTDIIHPVPVCPAPVMYDDYYYDDYGYSNDDYYYDDGYYADAVYGYNDTDDGYWGSGGYYDQDWQIDPYYDAGVGYTTASYSNPIYVDSSTPSWYAYSDQYYGWPRLYRRLWLSWVSPYRYYRMSYYWNQLSYHWWDTYWSKFWSTHLTLGLRF